MNFEYMSKGMQRLLAVLIVAALVLAVYCMAKMSGY